MVRACPSEQPTSQIRRTRGKPMAAERSASAASGQGTAGQQCVRHAWRKAGASQQVRKKTVD